jgi:MoaA/NifB/PqqE/SkfB family radical SAM enzyme
MGFEQILQKTWRDNILFSVLVELTYRCNLDCFFCYNDLGLRGEPLRTEQYFDFFAELRDLQVLNLTLSGGEPLAHPDFLRLGARARELGFLVRVKSNGHALRGEAARRLRDEVDPFLVEVSLHGAVAATHDRQTRVPGSFDRLLANLREALDLGLRIKINSTMTAWNEGEIEGMLSLADSLGVRLQLDPEVTPRDDRRGSRQERGAAAWRWPREGTTVPSRPWPGSTAAPARRGSPSIPMATSTPVCSGGARWGTCTGSRSVKSGPARPGCGRCVS